MNVLMGAAQERKCHQVIHSAARGAGVGNLIPVPVPGTGLAADMIALVSMSMSMSMSMSLALAAIFGQSLTESAAQGMAMGALKRTALQQPVKVLDKEAAKLVPWFGSALAACIAVTIVEATGWALANEMARAQPILMAP